VYRCEINNGLASLVLLGCDQFTFVQLTSIQRIQPWFLIHIVMSLGKCATHTYIGLMYNKKILYENAIWRLECQYSVELVWFEYHSVADFVPHILNFEIITKCNICLLILLTFSTILSYKILRKLDPTPILTFVCFTIIFFLRKFYPEPDPGAATLGLNGVNDCGPFFKNLWNEVPLRLWICLSSMLMHLTITWYR
jgi:hypothetical protein